jgi:hypothetical protein
VGRAAGSTRVQVIRANPRELESARTVDIT